MMYLSDSQWLLWGGIGAMAGAIVLAAISLVVFSVTGRKLKKRLEEEYGEPQR